MIDYESWRLPLIILACVQAFLTSGIFYGWAALYLIFLDGGVYSNLCSGPSICDAQKERLQFVYTVASSSNLVAQLFWGFILDHFGPRKCCFCSGVFVMIGFVLLGFSGREFDGYLPGVILMAGGGPGVQISLFHLSVLFPENETTVLGVITGSFQLGFIVFVCFKFAFAQGIPMNILFFSYCLPLGVLLFLGLLLWPEAPLSLQVIEDEGESLIVEVSPPFQKQPEAPKLPQYASFADASPLQSNQMPKGGTSHRKNGALVENYGGTSTGTPSQKLRDPSSSPSKTSVSAISSVSESELDPTTPRPAELPEPTLRVNGEPRERRRSSVVIEDSEKKFSPVDRGFLEQLLSWSFLFLLIWMSVAIFWANFYIGSVVEQLWEKTEHSKQLTRWYSDLFNLLLPVGVLGIPLFGAITDKFGFPAGILLTSGGGICYSLLAMTNALSFQIQTFLLYSFFRTFIFATMFSYIAHEFGYRYFGILSGLVLCCGGFIGFLQYPLQSSGLSWSWIDLLQLASMVGSLPYALYVHFLEKSKYLGYQSLLQQIDRQQKQETLDDDHDYYDDS